MWAAVLIACQAPESHVDGGSPPIVADTSPFASPTGSTGDTGVSSATGDTATVPVPTWDCGALPGPPFATTTISSVPPSEDFAFDDEGHLVSHEGYFFWKSEYPPGDRVAWAPTETGTEGPASIRRLSTGDFVYHDVNTSTLYRIAPDGSSTQVYSGFGYAGGIEIGETDLVYVVDLMGIHVIDPYALEHDVHLEDADWLGPNGITRSLDGATMYVSATNGIWSFPLDAEGLPAGPATPWADAPPGVSSLLGMGVDACGNVYVVGSGRLLRYASIGGDPVELFAEPTAWLSNLQWGSGIGGWSSTHLFVVDQRGGTGFHELDLGVGEKPRP